MKIENIARILELLEKLPAESDGSTEPPRWIALRRSTLLSACSNYPCPSAVKDRLASWCRLCPLEADKDEFHGWQNLYRFLTDETFRRMYEIRAGSRIRIGVPDNTSSSQRSMMAKLEHAVNELLEKENG